MNASGEAPAEPVSGLRLLTLILLTAVVGLPVNDLYSYGLLLVAAVLTFTGFVSAAPRRWLAAAAIAGIAFTGHWALPLPHIEEGHNIFLGDRPNDAIKVALPARAYQFMEAEFLAQYPPERWCEPAKPGCWRSPADPLPAFGFSADGLFTHSAYSRRPSKIDFSNGMALRLGFINDLRFHWYGDNNDLKRSTRDSRSLAIFSRWTLTMPYFVIYRMPADHVGGTLCWRGNVLWEDADAGVAIVKHSSMACRVVQHEDVNRRIIGVSIDRNAPLAMTLHANATMRLQTLLHGALTILGFVGVFVCLVRWRRELALPAFLLVGIALGYVAVIDLTMLGWWRPFDGGDDGLSHMGLGRLVVQALQRGDIYRALEGAEAVYYNVPGFRYFRAIEQIMFGDTVLGYVSVLVALPFLVFVAARRFLPDRWAVFFLIAFIATPIGAIFGTNFAHHARWAAKGFGEPLAYAFFLGGLGLIVPSRFAAEAPKARWKFWGAMLFALAVFVRPNLGLIAAIFLSGAAILALHQSRFLHVIALGAGFAPILLVPLHNWAFGNTFVLFTSALTTFNFATPPSAYLQAARELLTLDFGGGHVGAVARQLVWFLSGPSELFIMVPLHVAALGILIRIGMFGRGFEPWLRLASIATLSQYGFGLFYQHYDRYHLLTWLLTGLVTTAWLREEGLVLFARRWPDASRATASHPLIARTGALAAHVIPRERVKQPS